MESFPLLTDVVKIMAVSVPVAIILTKIRIPIIVGFLLSGLIIGPYGFAIVTEVHNVEKLAEIGVVLLLFTIGLEFNVKKMLNIRREAMIGGGLQLGLTIGLVYLIMTFLDFPFEVALVVGFIISLSSSAIVLKLLQDAGDTHAPHGNLSVGILLFQDICMVFMVLILQSFVEAHDASPLYIVKKLSFAVLAVVVIIFAISYIIPRIFHMVVRLKNREVFVLTIVLACLGTAWLTSLAGLSLALGAFIAGLVISESEYSNQIVAEVLPLRDTFTSLFFVSIGMLLNLGHFMDNFLYLMAITLGIVALKFLVVILIGQIMKYPLRLTIIVGLSLAQIGEFSFILINEAFDGGLLEDDLYQMFLAVAVFTMAITPFMFKGAPVIAHFLSRKSTISEFNKRKTQHSILKNHVIIVGYGLNGQNLAKVLKEVGIEFLVLDVSVDRVKNAKKNGHKAYFGDASHPHILNRMGLESAKALVLAVSDPIGTRKTISSARGISKEISIIVRTRYLKEVTELYDLGATQVIPEEFETSIELFGRVLREYKVPSNIIRNQIDIIRSEGYQMFQDKPVQDTKVTDISEIIEKSTMDTFYVSPDSKACGREIKELGFGDESMLRIMAIVRHGEAITNPSGSQEVQEGDILVLLGNHASLNMAMEKLRKFNE